MALDSAGKRWFSLATPLVRTVIPDGSVGETDRRWLNNWYFVSLVVVVPQPWTARGSISGLYSGTGEVTALYGAHRGQIGALYDGEGTAVNI